MRVTWLCLMPAASAALAACGLVDDEQQTASHHGRYLGIGVYEAGRMWSRMVRANRAADPAAATTADDEKVIVVVDSHSGEVRQCGNLTGYCIGMNPWAGPLGREQGAPIGVTEHAADLDRQALVAENGSAGDIATNAAASAPAR